MGEEAKTAQRVPSRATLLAQALKAAEVAAAAAKAAAKIAAEAEAAAAKARAAAEEEDASKHESPLPPKQKEIALGLLKVTKSAPVFSVTGRSKVSKPQQPLLGNDLDDIPFVSTTLVSTPNLDESSEEDALEEDALNESFHSVLSVSVLTASQHMLPDVGEAIEAMEKVTQEDKQLEKMRATKQPKKRRKNKRHLVEWQKNKELQSQRIQKRLEEQREKRARVKERYSSLAETRRQQAEEARERKRLQLEKRSQRHQEEARKYNRHVAKIRQKHAKAKSEWKPPKKTPRGFISSSRKEFSPENIRFSDKLRKMEEQSVTLARAGLVQTNGRPFPAKSPPKERLIKRSKKKRGAFGSKAKRSLPW